jgi:hypothetical protein
MTENEAEGHDPKTCQLCKAQAKLTAKAQALGVHLSPQTKSPTALHALWIGEKGDVKRVIIDDADVEQVARDYEGAHGNADPPPPLGG